MARLIALTPYIVSALTSSYLALYAYRRRQVPAALPFAVFNASLVLYTTGYICELLAVSLTAKVAWDSFQLIGMFVMFAACVVMAHRHIGRTAPYSRHTWLLGSFIPVAVTTACLTDTWHHQLRQSAHIVPDYPFSALWYSFTWVDYLGFAFVYGAWLYALGLLARHWRKGNALVRRQTLALILGLSVPNLLQLLLVFGLHPLSQRDPEPFTSLGTSLILGWGIFRARLFELLPVARAVVMDHMSDGVIVVDPSGHVVDANPAVAGILSCTVASLLGRSMFEATELIELAHIAARKSAASFSRNEGTEDPRWFEITVHPVTGSANRTLGTLFVYHDVTVAKLREHDLLNARDALESKVTERTHALLCEIDQRKQTEQALVASEQRFRAIFNQSFQLEGLLDVHGVLLDANQAALTLVDVQLQDVIGRPFWETPWWSRSEQEVYKLKSAIAQAATGAFVRFETNILAKDGTLRTIDFSLKPVADASGNVTRLIPEGRDITALKRSEQERVSLTAQLHQAQRLEALGRLAGGIAHDFNNLLTVIGGNLSILQTFEPVGSEQHHALAECQHASDRASELTRQLLTFSRRQVVEPRVVDPAECLDGLQKLLRRVVGDHIRFTSSAQGEPGRLFMDPSQFEQIVMNLVVNARDSMPGGGSIDIVLRHHDGTIPNAGARFQDPGAGYVLLAVTDTGSGIDDSVIEHIFEPFFTTKDANSGTGLGLATVHGIVTHMSGHIAVGSRVGQGTTFEIYLPCCHEQIVTLLTVPSPKQVTSSGVGDSVLVVEDQTSVRDLVTRILRRQGFCVSAFADGAGALEFANDLSNRFDIVLTDVVMPNMGGRALADAIRQRRPDVPIVFMSGQSDGPVVQQSVNAAHTAFIAKPFTAMALVHTLRTALARSNDSK